MLAEPVVNEPDISIVRLDIDAVTRDAHIERAAAAHKARIIVILQPLIDRLTALVFQPQRMQQPRIDHAAGNTVKASEATAKAARKAAENTKKAGEFIARHKKGFLIVGGIAAMIVLILCTVSSCSLLIQGGATGVNVSTYPSEDADMLAAEEQYCAMEAELQQYLDTYESTHDYDEYHFELDDIEHDPYVLILSLIHI